MAMMDGEIICSRVPKAPYVLTTRWRSLSNGAMAGDSASRRANITRIVLCGGGVPVMMVAGVC